MAVINEPKPEPGLILMPCRTTEAEPTHHIFLLFVDFLFLVD